MREGWLRLEAEPNALTLNMQGACMVVNDLASVVEVRALDRLYQFRRAGTCEAIREWLGVGGDLRAGWIALDGRKWLNTELILGLQCRELGGVELLCSGGEMRFRRTPHCQALQAWLSEAAPRRAGWLVGEGWGMTLAGVTLVRDDDEVVILQRQGRDLRFADPARCAAVRAWLEAEE